MTLAEAILQLGAAEDDPDLGARLRAGLGTEDQAAFDVHIAIVAQHAAAAREARASQTMYRTLVEQIPAVTYYRSLETPGAPMFVSPQVARLTGDPPEAFVADPGLWARRVHPDDLPRVRAEQARFQPADMVAPVRTEYRVVRRDGRTLWAENYALAVRDEAGRATFLMGVIFDVTERRRLEDRLHEAQRLEAVGRLAGGVAHDFNNVLSVILSYGSALSEDLSHEDPRRADLAEIVRAGERARGLTRELLAIGRCQMLEPRTLDLGNFVRELESMLRRILGGVIELVFELPTGWAAVCADPAQVTQILVNLAANARDALPAGGRVVVTVDAIAVAGADAEALGLPQGSYVRARVRDNGCGMDPAAARRAFEPFFTTKDANEHLGLGLSSAFGIARQSGGTIAFDSDLGHGTVVDVYLPAAAPPAPPEVAALNPSTNATGATGAHVTRVLIAEDDEAVRRLVRRMLEHQGFQVIEARDAVEALAFVTRGDPFDVLLTDVVMPQMTGIQLAERVEELRPRTPIVFMSGHSEDFVRLAGVPNNAPLLQKPFSREDLAARLVPFVQREND